MQRFCLNAAQRRLHRGLWYRNAVLKARQLGISTYVALLMLDRWIALADKPAVPPLPVNGNDLIRLGFRPGVRLGLLLGELRDLFLEGTLTTREALLGHARKQLPPS